jgi:hypothetical protein
MPAGEPAEGGEHQGVGLWMERETGNPQTIHPVADHGHRMAMATEVEQPFGGLRGMAQPPGAEGLGGCLLQALQPASPFMIAADQA